ncbi:retention module-containing protein, partial [Niveibacterium sp. COAC-50]|uniref:retention module-containing protein n=1 Tax=Niveibacterium sp. COAC-50 TaxID=2729384 RepID=UPI001551EFF7
MATTTNRAEGTVARLEGKAWVREADGSLRPIHLGDRIAEGQVVVTDNGAVIELRGPHGDPVTLGGGREVLADAGLLTQDAVPAQDAALTPPDAELERVIASLNAGADPLAELDPTAAGLGGGSGGDGHGFVRLLRISEGVDPLSFQTSGPIATDTVERQTLSAITTDANAAPEAAPLSVTLPEDTSTGIRLDGVLSDPNGDPVTLVGTPTASVGTVTVNTDGTLTYTPPPNYNGPATIIYTVSDGRGATTDGTITVNVTPVNDAPTATNVAVTTLEDTPVAGRTPGSDVDGDTLSYAKGSDPAHGSVTVNTDGTWVYTPTKDYNGPDSFTVTVSDGKGGTTTATVSVGVTPVNDAPVPGTTDGPAGTPVSDANIDPATGHYTLSTPEDTPISGQVKATDVDGDSLSFAKASDPAHGSVTVNTDGTWTYTPAKDFNGPDSFTVTVSDGKGGTAIATVDIGVTPVGDVAVITPATLGGDQGNVTEDAVLLATGKLNVVDPDTGEAVFQAGTQTGSYGQLTIDANGNWTYTLDNASATVQALKSSDAVTDTIVVRSADGTPHNIVVTVHGQDETSTTGRGTVQEDTTLTSSGTLVATGVSTYVAGTQTGAYGNLAVGTDGAWTYTLRNGDTAVQALNAGDGKSETFVVKLSDGSTTTVSINVLGTNDIAVITPATPGADAGAVKEDVTLTTGGQLLVSDVDAGQAVFQPQTAVAGAHGSFSIDTAGNWTYTLNNADPAVQALGEGQSLPSEVFTVKSADGTTSTVTVAITGTNDGAVITPATPGADAGAVKEDVTLTTGGQLLVSDVDAGQAVFQSQTAVAGAHGSFSIDAAGNWTYTLNNADPAVQALGEGQSLPSEVFTVKSADGTTSTVTVAITGTNDGAVITPATPGADAGAVKEDVTLTASGQLVVTDVDAGQAVFQPQTAVAGAHGSFSIDAAGNWTYALNNADPAVQALGEGQSLPSEVFTVKSADGTTSTVTVTITGTNDGAQITPSVPGGDTGSVTEDAVLLASGKLLVSDVDTGEAGFQASTQAGAYGSLTIDAAGNWSYSLNNAAANVQSLKGTDTVTETIVVKSLDGTPHSIVITVHGQDETTASGNGTVREDTTLTSTGTLTTSGVATFVPETAAGAYGDLVVAADGTWTYTLRNADSAVQALNATDSKTETFTVALSDGSSTSITINVLGTNDIASIQGPGVGAVQEAGGIANAIPGTPNASGTLLAADADNGEAGFQAVAPAALNGTYGTFTFNAATGAWTYALDNTKAATQALTNGQIVHDTLTVTSLDGTATKAIDVTVTGANDTAAITGTATGTMTEDVAVTGGNLTASGNLAVIDVDAGQAVFATPATLAGTYGTFTFNTTTGAWTYAANNAQSAIQSLGAGQSLTDSITVKSADGTASQVISVTINGANDGAVITPATPGADAGAVKEDVTLTASGQLVVTDVDAGQAVFQPQTAVAGAHGTFSIDAAGNWVYTLNNADPVVQALGEGQSLPNEVFTVKSADGTASTVTVAITGTNDGAQITPSVLGADTGAVKEDVTLTTSGQLLVSDVDAGQAVFQPQTAVAGAHGSFSIDAAGNWTYTLNNADPAVQALGEGQSLPSEVFTVKSADGTSSTVTVAITGTNDGPVAAVDFNGLTKTDTTAASGNVLTNDSDIDTAHASLIVSAVGATPVSGTTVVVGNYGTLTIHADGSYTYVQDASNAAVIALKPTDAPLHDVFNYTLSDGSATSNATLDIAISGANTAPVAMPAHENVTEGGALFNGNVVATDAEGDALSYSLISPAPAGLTFNTDGSYSFNPANPAYDHLAAGQTQDVVVTYQVADGKGGFDTDTLTITIVGTNDGATIGGTATGTVVEAGGVANAIAGTPNASGTVTVSDVDAG